MERVVKWYCIVVGVMCVVYDVVVVVKVVVKVLGG